MSILIKLVVPEKGYIKNALDVFQRHHFTIGENSDKEDVKFELEEVMVPTEKVGTVELHADVIVSRGILTKRIKEEYKDVPIVDIPVQGIDLIKCITNSLQKYSPKRIAVIGTSNMIYGVDQFESIFHLSIEKFILDKTNEVDHVVKRAKHSGCDLIIGGYSTHVSAKQIGIPSVIVETSEESLFQAFNEAKRLAYVSRKEQEKAKQYQTILDHSYEGVISINLDGEISVFNESAKKMLQVHQSNVLQSELPHVLLRGELLDFILDDKRYGEEILTYQTITLNVKKQPVLLRGKRVGDVIAFHDITGIQEMERKIRRKVFLRGHVAKYTFDHIIHQSQVVKNTIQTAKKFSEVESNILIIGETGTGKEMYAQSIHNESERRNKPFVAINCAALPENLLESELFGYVEGAFTGAAKGGKQGIFELAHQGTLFLDEIGEVTPSIQSRLLRVIQEKEVMRLGDDRVIPVDVRIVAATNKDLLTMVEKNAFREDLYYRLCVLELYLPSLRESKEDIPLLARQFLKQYGKEKNIYLTKNAEERLKHVHWGGNIRQLQNVCERIAVLTTEKEVNETDLIQYLPKSTWLHEKKEHQTLEPTSEKDHEELEKENIITVLEQTKYNREKAAKKLGMSRTTLWRKMKQYYIE